jgi:DNA-binding NarL/FixJ family response regulator
MQPERPSIWSHDSNETASGKPGTLQKADQVQELIGQGWKQADVASELGISRSSVQRIVRSSIKKQEAGIIH